MATIASAKSGNWSDPTTWDGGVLPDVPDTVQVLTGHVVTIDQDVSVYRMTHTGTGQYLITGNTPRNISASLDLLMASTATIPLVVFDSNYTAEGTVITSGTASANGNAGAFIMDGSSGSVQFVLDRAYGGSAVIRRMLTLSSASTNVDITARLVHSYTSSVVYVLGSSSSTINLTATENIAMQTNSSTIHLTGSGTTELTIKSPLLLGSGNTAHTLVQVSAATKLVNVTIDVDAMDRSGNNAKVIVNVSASAPGSSVTILKDTDASAANSASYIVTSSGPYNPNVVFKGDLIVRDAPAVLLMSTALHNVTIEGDLYINGSGSALYINGAYNANISTLSLGGDATISGTGSMIITTNSNRAILRVGDPSRVVTLKRLDYVGPVITSALVVRDGSEVIVEQQYGITGEPVRLTNADSQLNPSDVRAGVVYDSDDKVGTMAIPAPEDVYAGVPVDDTVGTASIKLSDAAAITGSQISSLSQ